MSDSSNSKICESVGGEFEENGRSDFDWPDPQPIPSLLLDVQPLDPKVLLPKPLRKWVIDVADRMQCPIDFVAVGILVVISSLICRKCQIEPKKFDNFRVFPIIWGVIIGRPGMKKSAALSRCQKFLDEFIERENEKYRIERKGFDADQKLQKICEDTFHKKIKQISKNDMDEARRLLMEHEDASDSAPILKRYMVNDSTVEALSEIMKDNPQGFLVYRDELSGLLESLDKEGQQGARSFYLQAYDGDQGYTVDRIMRGCNRHIDAVAFCLLGGMQPGKIKSYIRQSMTEGYKDDGLIQRFGLLVWPDSPKQWCGVDRSPDYDAEGDVSRIFKFLDEIQPELDSEAGRVIPRVYKFSDDAQAIYDESLFELENELLESNYPPAVESHFSKYRKLVPALALIFCLVNRESEVSVSSLCMALDWSDYLRSHAMRAYSAGSAIKTDAAAALLKRITAKALKDGFKPADVYLKGWAHLGAVDVVREALDLLVELGHLRAERRLPSVQGGRPSVVYHIHPSYL